MVACWLLNLLTCSAKSFFLFYPGTSVQNCTLLKHSPCISHAPNSKKKKTNKNKQTQNRSYSRLKINQCQKKAGEEDKETDLKFLFLKEKLMCLCEEMTPRSGLFRRQSCYNTNYQKPIQLITESWQHPKQAVS